MSPERACSEPNTPRLAVQAGWLLIAKLIGFIISFVAPLIVIRALDQREFGLYKQAFLMFTTALPLLTLAFYMNVFYFLPRRPAEGPKIVLNVLIVHAFVGLVAVVALLSYPGILVVLFGGADLVRYVPLMAAVLFLTIFGYFLEVVATANQDVRFSTTFIIAAQFTKGVAMVTGALVTRSVEGLLYAAACQGLIQSCILFWYLHRKFPGFIGRPDWRLLREQIVYAVPLGLAVTATLAQTDLHLYIVARYFSAGEYAIYAVGCFQLPLVGMLREAVNAVMIPRISYLQQQGATQEIIILLARAMRTLAFVYLPVYAFLTVTAYEFISLLYTPRYATSVPIFVTNLLTVPLLMFLYDPVFRAYAQHTRFLLRVRMVEAAILLPGIYLGIREFGMAGAITVVVIVVVADTVMAMWKITRILEMKRSDLLLFSDLGKLALAALLASSVAEIMRRLLSGSHPVSLLLGTGLCFVAAYAAAVIWLGVLTAEETGTIRNKLLYVRRVLKAA